MMKWMSVLLICCTLVACAQKKRPKGGSPWGKKKVVTDHPTYVREKNCSKKGLAYLAKTNNIHITFEDEDKKIEKFMLSKSGDVHACYQKALDENKTNKEYVACVIVGLKPDGVMEFLDVADVENGLNKSVKECLTKKFLTYSYKTFSSKYGLTILQPFNLYLKP